MTAARERISVHGSYYGYNFGDTLLCALFVGWVREARPQAGVHLPLANRRNQDLIGADGRGPIGFLRSSTVVFAGGGYFGQPGSHVRRWSIRHYWRHLVVADLARLLGKRILVLGIGAGPLSSGFLRRRLRALLDAATIVVVRDDESLAFTAELGTTSEVTVLPDAALATPARLAVEAGRSDANGAAGAAGPSSPSRRMVVHLARRGEGFAEVVAALRRFLAAHPDVDPVLVTDTRARRKGVEQDLALARLVEALPDAEVRPYDGDPWALCELLATAGIVVTTKLHVGIVATSLGAPVISLPQHQKTQRFYGQLGRSELCLDPGDAERLGELLERWVAGGLPPLEAVPDVHEYRDLVARGLSWT